MATQPIIDRLTETLHAYNLSWLLPNLRQDFVIWSSLNDEAFYEKLMLAQPQEQGFLPLDFSPARLACVALGQCSGVHIDPRNLFEAVDSQVLQTAIRNYPDQLFRQPGSQNLAQAGMIALALAYKFHITRSWIDLIGFLPEQDLQDWLAPLTCLYGMVDTPEELLRALVQPGASAGRVKLAIHCVLSNPYTPDEQLNLLASLCSGPYGDLLPASDRLRLVEELLEQSHELTERFCAMWLSRHPDFGQALLPTEIDPGSTINQLLGLTFQLQIRQIAGQTQDLSWLLPLEISLLNHAYAGIASQLLALPGKTETATQMLDMAVQAAISPQAPDGITSSGVDLALTLIDRGLYTEAACLLPSRSETQMDDLTTMYAIFKLSSNTGAKSRAASAMTRLTELLNQEDQLDCIPTWGEHLSLANLGNLLLENYKPLESARLFEQALKACPNEAVLLSQLAACYRAAHQEQQAAETYRVLVALHPARLDFRRDFAGALERTNEWQGSLDQYTLILAAKDAEAPDLPIEDFYGYARCALKAQHPDLTQNVCNELLANDPDDSQALIYLGEACLLLGQADQGLECLQRATQITPKFAEAWLALAKAQKVTCELEVVVETLKNATLAVPDSAEVRHLLGNLYLENNSASLALPELRFAAELAPELPHILVSFAQALKELGHQEDARATLARAYALDPNLPGLAHTYASALLELGRFEEALSPLELLIDAKAIDDPATYLEYARCVLALHRSGVKTQTPMKALIALNEALQLDPELAEARALTADVLAACGENELAFQAYREALDTPLRKDKQWFERLSYGFGCTASAIGKHDVAIAALQEANQANPENPATCMALSEAYLLANLAQDAVRAAHNVLAIDGDNPDHLSWFAGQMSRILWGKAGGAAGAPSGFYKEIPSQILEALHRAIELAPNRTDLIIQLGNFQAKLGAKEQARDTFASMAGMDCASIEDLQAAATFLSRIDEHTSAITCLAKAIDIDQAVNSQHVPALYTSLAHEFLLAQDQASALQTLDQGTNLLPAESSIVSLKLEILLGQGRTQDALDSVDEALLETNDDEFKLELLSTAMRINLAVGDLAGAAGYARKAVELSPAEGSDRLPLRLRTQLAELYRLLLQPQQAYQILSANSNADMAASTNTQEYLDYLCLHTELALETGEPLKHEIQDVQGKGDNPKLLRLIALQARLINKAGNTRQATRLLEAAVDKANISIELNTPQNWEAPALQHLNLVALSEAAAEIGLFEASIELSQQAAKLTSDPLPLLNLAKAIILRAEFDQLCDTFDVMNHKPSNYARTPENFTLARQYLEQAQGLLEQYRDEPINSDHPLNSDQIYRWQARAAIIFGQDVEPGLDAGEVLLHHGAVDDMAALIHHLRNGETAHPESEALIRIIKLARNYPRNPAVILQVALALEHSNPDDAVRSLQAVLAQNPFVKSPIATFCSYLLARIAHLQSDEVTAGAAIETAIEYWNDEPCWHALAARVCKTQSEVAKAIEHLQAAYKLDPREISYSIELGSLYLANAAEDTHLLHQACRCFESALILQPDELDALLGLAQAQYQLNDLDSADSNARKALTLTPDLGRTYQLLGEIAIRRNDYQGAYEYANKAIVASPRDVRSTIVLARSLSALGRHSEALTKINTAISSAEDAELLELERVSIICRMDGARAALLELQKLADAHPGNFRVLSALAKMYFEVGESENAVTSAQHALSTNPDLAVRNEQANLHLLIGQILRKAGQLEAAIEHLTAAMHLAPDRLEPYLELGLARKERHEYQQALQIFEQATLVAPEDPRALFQAGLALKESKDYKSSESMLRRAVSLAPNDLTIRRQLAAVVALNLVHNPRIGRS